MSSLIRIGKSMKSSYPDIPNGYMETISEGMKCIGFLDWKLTRGNGSVKALKEAMDDADAIVVGAGAGLSTSAGLTYSGKRFMSIFSDFHKEYGITDMYSGGFYPFPSPEIMWAWWSRHIYFNRYVDPPKPVYSNLLSILDGNDYFVVTTNVDHQFQRAGFDKKRLFYTQGDYGLFQSTDPNNHRTYDNEIQISAMLESQGFVKDGSGIYRSPPDGVSMKIDPELIPICPDDGMPMTLNLRSDDSFVEDDGWRSASARYSDYLRRHEGQSVLYLEIGVGSNTPVIVKYPFWFRTWKDPKARYACLNYGETYCPKDISDRSICIDGDVGTILLDLNES